MLRAVMAPRSSRMPPSVVLWPPLRTASSNPVSRANATTWATSLASSGRTMTRRAAVDAAVEDGAGLVVARVAGRDHSTVDGGVQPREQDRGEMVCLRDGRVVHGILSWDGRW